eukprot:scaffold3714_cov30-Tisochrysis_lutea.AAC.1
MDWTGRVGKLGVGKIKLKNRGVRSECLAQLADPFHACTKWNAGKLDLREGCVVALELAQHNVERHALVHFLLLGRSELHRREAGHV